MHLEKLNYAKINNKFSEWHFPMLNDEERNEKYYKAITVQGNCKNKIIMDLGSGSSLLALIAIKNGAKLVYAIEQDYNLYQIAKRIIKENNAEEKIILINKPIQKVDFDDIKQKVDIIVTEIFSGNLIGEGCLRALECARKFLKEDGSIIPESGSIIASLGQSKEIKEKYFLKKDIFDLNISSFNYFKKYGVMCNLSNYAHKIVSKTKTLTNFEFKSNYKTYNEVKLCFDVNNTIDVDFVALWFKLNLDQDNVLENFPKSNLHWDQFLIFPDESVSLSPGNKLQIDIIINNERLIVNKWQKL